MVDGIESLREIEEDQHGYTSPVEISPQVSSQGGFHLKSGPEASLKWIYITCFYQETLDL